MEVSLEKYMSTQIMQTFHIDRLYHKNEIREKEKSGQADDSDTRKLNALKRELAVAKRENSELAMYVAKLKLSLF